MAIIMKKKIKVFLIPTLMPLLILLSISFLNFDKKISIKILIWKTEEISLGTSIAVCAFSGFIIGSIPSLLLQRSPLSKRRKVVSQVQGNKESLFANFSNDDYREDEFQEDNRPNIYLERDVRDPAPTLSVPFKILRKSQTNISNNSIKRQEEFQPRSFDNEKNEQSSYDTVSRNPEYLDWLDKPDENW